MALQAPVLDDRKFQQIVDEAKKRIARYCPEWTDHNVSDPGVTMIELFAWMMEMLLYRMNQVPELHYIKFLELLGVQRQPPTAATADITFWLSEPLQDKSKTIEANTELATTQTETKPSIVFTTEHDFEIKPPELHILIQERNERVVQTFTVEKTQIKDNQGNPLGNNGINVFTSEPPSPGDTLYFGFTNDISRHILRLTLRVQDLRAAGGGRDLPPYVWQAYAYDDKTKTADWLRCEVDEDRTENMNHSNSIQLHLPKMLNEYSLEGHKLFWVRVCLIEQKYSMSPLLYEVTATAMGATIPVMYAKKAEKELFGQSNGLPDQRFFLAHKPVLGRRTNENLHVVFDNSEEVWEEKPDFADSTVDSCHYTLDRVSGEIRLGPAIRQPDGTIKQYGRVPPLGAQLSFCTYYYRDENFFTYWDGDQKKGLIDKGDINTLKTSISYIKRVKNLEKPIDGKDVEELEQLKLRIAKRLRTSGRAVTAEDFELLALEYNQDNEHAVARARCLPPGNATNNNPTASGTPPQVVATTDPNVVQLFLVPYIEPDATSDGRLTAEQLAQSFQACCDKVRDYLKERCLLTTRVQINPVEYTWVAVYVNLDTRALVENQRSELRQRILTKLYNYLNPITGGPNHDGWPFGAAVRIEEIYKCLRTEPYAEDARFIREVTLFQATPDGNASRQAREEIPLNANSIVASGKHNVSFD